MTDWKNCAKSFLKAATPPILLKAAKRLAEQAGVFGPPEWEYVPEGWQRTAPGLTGWNAEGIVRTQLARWEAFVESTKGVRPLAGSHEAGDPGRPDYGAHNTLMTYGYALALAAHRRDKLSILDWGGGIGHYYVLSRALLPDVALEYYCRDLPLFCEAGRKVVPAVRFCDNDRECMARSYDFVLSSSSLQYSMDWKAVARKLCEVSEEYLLITRIPVVFHAGSFVVLQRPYRHGYNTEYLGWFWNRDEFVAEVTAGGMSLVREFLIDERPVVRGAPEQAEYRGYLFRKTGSSARA